MGPCLSVGFKAKNPAIFSNQGSNDTNGANPRAVGEILQNANLRLFEFSELRTATMDFDSKNVLREDHFGVIFKGWIDENSLTAATPATGMAVAVKRINRDGSQGLHEWLVEIKYLGQLCHPNIVKLIGYCRGNDCRLLVYEYMPDYRTLENILFGSESITQLLSWNIRMKIAIGAAKGLLFLHDEAKIILRDFNTSNILIDYEYNAKLSNFGLAKDGPVDGKTHVTTRILGTEWYLAPEFSVTGHLTSKSDVYSFGVVLLEILSGRRAIEMEKESPERNLVEWAKPLLNNQRKIYKILDPFLKANSSKITDKVFKAADLANQCLSFEANKRPKMDEIVKILEQL